MQNKIQALPDGSQMTKLDVSTCFLAMASLTAISQQLPEGSGPPHKATWLFRGRSLLPGPVPLSLSGHWIKSCPFCWA